MVAGQSCHQTALFRQATLAISPSISLTDNGSFASSLLHARVSGIHDALVRVSIPHNTLSLWSP